MKRTGGQAEAAVQGYNGPKGMRREEIKGLRFCISQELPSHTGVTELGPQQERKALKKSSFKKYLIVPTAKESVGGTPPQKKRQINLDIALLKPKDDRTNSMLKVTLF